MEVCGCAAIFNIERRSARSTQARGRIERGVAERRPPFPARPLRLLKIIDGRAIPLQIVGHMPESKDTPKAIVIIVTALAVLIALLTFANHIRPHP
jgi:hypothetical protein